MTSAPFDLEQLLDPIGVEQFFSTFWEQRHLCVHRAQSTYYQSLLTAKNLEELISHSDARYPAIRLARGGHYIGPEAYTRDIKHGDENFLGVPDVRRIAEEYARGATIAMPAIHRTWTPLGLLCDRIHARLDHPIHANVYVTPGNTAGFTPHYDVHEVFVLQIAGKKRWSIYEPVIRLPHRTQLFTPQLYAGQKPMTEVELTAGDLLYLPRGFLHSTSTSDSFSAHVTVGVTVYTWIDLVKEYLVAAIENEDLRKALPPGFAHDTALKPLLRQKMLGAIETLQEGVDSGRLVDAFTSRVSAAHGRDWTAFNADIVVIEFESALQMPEPSNYQITEEETGSMLEFKGQRYRLPAPVASTLRAMAQLEIFRPVDLPDHLSPDGKLGLSRHLYGIGFLLPLPSHAK